MDESSSDEEGDLPPGVSKTEGRTNQIQPPVPEKVIVKKGYNPKQSTKIFT